MYYAIIVMVLVAVGIAASALILGAKRQAQNNGGKNDASSKLKKVFYSRCSDDCYMIDLSQEKIMDAIFIADYGNRMIRYGAINKEGNITQKVSASFDTIIDFWIEKNNDHVPIQEILMAPLLSILIGLALGAWVAFFIKWLAIIVFLISVYIGIEILHTKRERLYERYRRSNIKINIITTSHTSPLISFAITPQDVSMSVNPDNIDSCRARIEATLKQIILFYKYYSDGNYDQSPNPN